MKPQCCVCHKAVIHGNLYCSEVCGKSDKNQIEQHKQALLAEGFQVSDTPNVLTKDGVAVTLEAAKHVGISETLIQHAAAVGRKQSL